MISLSQDQIDSLDASDLELLELVADFKERNLLDYFQPYPTQLEFIQLTGKPNTDEYMLFAGNQLGKTEVGAYMMACHLTGRYPEWWTGYRYQRPIIAWACTVSTQTIREVTQVKLLGENYFGKRISTGYLPADCVVSVNTMRGAGAETAEVVRVKHFDAQGNEDGVCIVTFKSYDQGREKFQARTLDLLWWDEEPDEKIYVEGLARLGATGGISYMTFTPLQGWSTVVNRFLRDVDPASRRKWLRMGYGEAKHMTPEKVEALLSRYPAHERNARMRGEPKLGSGAEFPYPESSLTVPVDMYVPPHWYKLWGIDFGISHPFGAALILWDKDRDIVYLWEAFAIKGAVPSVHAMRIQKIAGEVPVAWPHDGHRRDPGSGEELANFYKQAGLRMVDTHASFVRGGFSTEAILRELHERMTSGRFKVRADLNEFWEEYRMYHRDEDGQLVKIQDDVLSALMKAVMMKRAARQENLGFSNWGIAKKMRAQIHQAEHGNGDAFMDAWNMRD